MPKIQYKEVSFASKSLKLIRQANEIVEAYAAQGYDLTLRQIYYQLVTKTTILNKQTEYKRLGDIINSARLAGLIDWDAITDRTRNLRRLSHWDSPADIIRSARDSFHIDLWADQDHRVEVWIEKDALVGVIEGVCNQYDTPYFSCRGYSSQSEMWGAAQRILDYMRDGKTVVILHLGDHDPSGMDMTRDITDRLWLFINNDWDEDEFGDRPEFRVRRIALNTDQVRQYSPPPNPAKTTDSRHRTYMAEFGTSSWELDALDPKVISALIRKNIVAHIDADRWNAALEKQKTHKQKLALVSDKWDDVVACVGKET